MQKQNGICKLLCQLLISGLFFFVACSKSSPESSDTNAPLPIVNSIVPVSGGVGTILTIYGNNFSRTATENIVSVNGVTASVLKATETELQVMVPVTTSGIVLVKTLSGSANGPIFNYLISPIVTITQNSSSAGGYTVASYWTNGILYNITGGTTNAGANGIATSGTDFLIAGYEFTGAYGIAKIWKNGIATSLAASTTHSAATCIATAGNDIYVGGYVINAGKKIATVWKNAVASALTNGAFDAVINAIAVSGNDIYVCGYETDGTKMVAKFWKNGIATRLTTGPYESVANGITISGSDVLIAGYEKSAFTGNGCTGIIWKNGIASSLPATPHNTFANAVTVSGNDTYIAGHYYHIYNNVDVGGMWKNGFFNNTYTGTVTDIKAITVLANNVYVVGYGYNIPGAFGTAIAKLWKNNIETNLTDATKSAIASAIIVK
jgi:IPT/TIG domain